MAETVDEYIASFPDDVQPVLRRLRETVRAAVPGGVESISYRMPTIKLDGTYVVYFGGYAHHVGVYPVGPLEHDYALEREVAPYRTSKATLRFPLDEPLPYDLVAKVVGYLVLERTRR